MPAKPKRVCYPQTPHCSPPPVVRSTEEKCVLLNKNFRNVITNASYQLHTHLAKRKEKSKKVLTQEIRNFIPVISPLCFNTSNVESSSSNGTYEYWVCNLEKNHTTKYQRIYAPECVNNSKDWKFYSEQSIVSQKRVSEKQLDINKYNSENLNIRSAVEGYTNSSKESESGEDGWQVVRRKKRPKEKRKNNAPLTNSKYTWNPRNSWNMQKV